MIIDQLFEGPQLCPECGGISFSDLILAEKKDACYYKVKASAKVWPSAYASGRLVQCRKKGAANYGNKSEGVAEAASNNIQLLIQKLEDMSEMIFGMSPGSKKNRLIDKRDELEAQIEAMPGGKEALRKWAREYNDSFDEGVVEDSEPDAYGNTGEKHECGSCDGTGIDTHDDECPECGGKGWIRDKESLKKKGMAEDDGFDVVSSYQNMRTTDTGNKSNQTYTSTAIAKNPATGQQKSLASWDHTDPKTRKNYSGSNYIDAQGNAEVQKNYEESKNKVNEVSLGDYRKKATVNKALAQTNKFFGRDDAAKAAAADQTIAKRERGLARADARRKPYTAPPVDKEKQRQQLTDKYPNIDELVRRAEVNRDSNYEYADGQAYYDGQEAEQEYQRLKQIQRIIQGLSESKTLSDYMDEAKGIRNPYDLQPLEGPSGMGGGGGGTTRTGPSPFGAKPGSREASIAQPNANTMTIKQTTNPDYRSPSQQSQTTGDKPKIKVNPGETVPQAIERTKTQQEFGKFLQGQSGQTFGAGAGRGSVNPAPANTMSNTPVSVKNKPSAMNSMAKDLTNPPKSSNTNTNTNTTTNNSPRQNDRVDPLDVYMPRSTAQDPFMPRDPFGMARPGYDGQLGSNPRKALDARDKQSSWLGKAGKTLGYGAAAYGAADVGSRAWDYYDQTKDMPSVKEAKKQPPEAKYDDDYDAMVARVKKLAGLGPMKTVYDPNKRVYRNVPTAVQPKK